MRSSSAIFKRPALGTVNTRRALAPSSRQNQNRTDRDVDNRAANQLDKPTEVSVGYRVSQSHVLFFLKTKSGQSEVNDENAEANVGRRVDAAKSKIPKGKAVTKAKAKSAKFVVTDMKTNGEQEVAFSTNLIPDNVEDIDANDSNNVFLTPDYVKEIYWYLRHLEVSRMHWSRV